MQPRAPKLLEDIRSAAAYVRADTQGITLQEFQHNRVLRQAVERNFEIIGEAMRRLEKTTPKPLPASPTTATSLPFAMC